MAIARKGGLLQSALKQRQSDRWVHNFFILLTGVRSLEFMMGWMYQVLRPVRSSQCRVAVYLYRLTLTL